MELSSYNLKAVGIEGRGCSLQPISECIVNGRKYTCDPQETDEEKIYIPVSELEFGCPICIPQQKKAYAVQVYKYFWKWYIAIWEMPYREEGIYTSQEVFETINNHRRIFDTPMKI